MSRGPGEERTTGRATSATAGEFCVESEPGKQRVTGVGGAEAAKCCGITCSDGEAGGDSGGRAVGVAEHSSMSSTSGGGGGGGGAG